MRNSDFFRKGTVGDTPVEGEIQEVWGRGWRAVVQARARIEEFRDVERFRGADKTRVD